MIRFRPPALVILGAFCVGPTLLPQPILGQEEIRLTEPQAAFLEDFGAIQTIRELADGRVLVADPLGGALYLVDMDSGYRTVVGREGQGPDEYLQPDAVWALPGGGTLLVDLGNGRLVRLGADLTFGPTQPIALGEPRPGQGMVVAIPQGVDGQGRAYARAMGGMGGEYPDSADILRIDLQSRSHETAARFKLGAVTQRTSGGTDNRQVSLSPIPLSPEDAWGVAPDGSVVLARVGDYHLEWLAPNGTVTRGPALPFDPIRIRRAEKEEYLAEQARAGGGIRVGVTVENGQMAMRFARGGPDEADRQIDAYTWPETKPPFYQGRIPVDLQGRAWVRRHVRAGQESTYDVFDSGGNRLATVLLPHGNRVIGFGERSVYVVSYDEFDLNYLERHALPLF